MFLCFPGLQVWAYAVSLRVLTRCRFLTLQFIWVIHFFEIYYKYIYSWQLGDVLL